MARNVLVERSERNAHDKEGTGSGGGLSIDNRISAADIEEYDE